MLTVAWFAVGALLGLLILAAIAWWGNRKEH